MGRGGPLRRAIARAPALLASLGIFVLLALVLRRGVDLPFSDEWDWTELVYAAHLHTLTFAQLWTPHNEHRMLVPNLIMLGLDAAGGWDVVREQLVSLAVLALSQLVVLVLVGRTVPPPLRGICFLVVSALLLGLAQYENFQWGFQFAWFLCDLCAVAAVWQLARARRSAANVALATAAAITGSVSSLPGLLIWPAGLVAIALAPPPRARITSGWLALGALTTLAVRWGSRGAPGGASLEHPAALVRYVLVYLGSPLALSYGVSVSLVAGIVVIGWLAAAVALALRGPALRRLRLAPWLALAAYAVLGAVGTAAGRAGFGFEQAAAPRYVTIAEFAWIGALAASCIVLPRAGRYRFAPAALAAALVLFASLHQSRAGNLAWRLHAAMLRDARAALARGDAAGLKDVYPDPARAGVYLGELARVRDGVFRTGSP